MTNDELPENGTLNETGKPKHQPSEAQIEAMKKRRLPTRAQGDAGYRDYLAALKQKKAR